MLRASTEFPQVGSHCFFDDVDQQNRPVVEPARILRNNGDGTVLVSLTDRRYPCEVASGNRTVDLARLRATETPEAAAPTVEAADLPTLIVGQEVIHSINRMTERGWQPLELRAIVLDPCVQDDPDYAGDVEIRYVTVEYLNRIFASRANLRPAPPPAASGRKPKAKKAVRR